MPVEITIKQKCDVCGEEEELVAENDARYTTILNNKLVLCQTHYDDAEVLKSLLANTNKSKKFIFEMWKRQSIGAGTISAMLTEIGG